MDFEYDPKRKSPARTRQARQRLGRALGALALLSLLFYWAQRGKGGGNSAKQPPSEGGELPAAAGPGTSPATAKAPPRLTSRLSIADRMSSLSPMYRGPGKVETLPAFANANRLLLATHNRLMWYRYDSDELRVIHEGQGVYYGAFTGEGRDALGAPTDLWVVSRPHNWHPQTSKEFLLHLNLETGKELGRVEVPSRFTHDAVRRRDKVYVCNTDAGSVLQLKFPSMELERELQLFTREEHINTLAPSVDGKLWVLLHNLGSSSLAEVDLAAGAVARRIPGVGQKSHGLVFWDRFMLVLDSEGGGLLQVDPKSGNVTTLWQLHDSRYFFKGLAVVDDIAFFGIAPRRPRGDRADPTLNCHLAAYDLKAGAMLWWRKLPTHGLLNLVAAPHLAVESTTYSLNTVSLVNYKTKPGFESTLAQALEAPLAPLAAAGEALAGVGELGGAAQSRAGAGAATVRRAALERTGGRLEGQHLQQRQQGLNSQEQGGGDGGDVAGQERPVKLSLSETEQLAPTDPLAKYPARIGGHWSSGYPRMDLKAKGKESFAAGLQLLLFRTDVSALKTHLLSLPDEEWSDAAQAARNAYLSGRNRNLDAVKPGARSILLMFSDHDGTQVARFPWYYRFQPLIEPLIKQIVGEADLPNLIRLQLAYMAPHTTIKIHQDNGGYASAAHRIHVVIATNADVVFAQCAKGRRGAKMDEVRATARILGQRGEGAGEEGSGGGGAEGEPDCMPIRVAEEGLVFELNNRLQHYVVNGGAEPRIHLVVDVAETAREPFDLAVGQTCDYSRGWIECGGGKHSGRGGGSRAHHS